MNLYTKYAEEFSKTRNTIWEGWIKLLTHILLIDNLNVLDIGCGNGRFIRFLVDNNVKFNSYLGVDYSKELLKIAEYNYTLNPNVKFSTINLLKNWDEKIKKLPKFNLIVAFGVTHHLETAESRELFFKTISEIIERSGYIILSFWKFKENENLFQTAFEISSNLYKLKFGKNATRICYDFEESEILQLIEKNSLEIIERYFADSKNNRGNEYFVLKLNENTKLSEQEPE